MDCWPRCVAIDHKWGAHPQISPKLAFLAFGAFAWQPHFVDHLNFGDDVGGLFIPRNIWQEAPVDEHRVVGGFIVPRAHCLKVIPVRSPEPS